MFTLNNNLPVTRLPEIPAGATSEETAALLAGFDPAADANTLELPHHRFSLPCR